jgi:hypothetical protein
MATSDTVDGVAVEIAPAAPSGPSDASRTWREESARALDMAALVTGGTR